jgi:hypothetical protein
MIREIEALKGEFEIVATGITPPHDQKVGFVSSNSFLFSHFEYTLGKLFRVLVFNRTYLGKYFSTQLKINKLLAQVKPDLIIVHEPAYLPYFFLEGKKYKVIFNAHEYHPLEVEGDAKWTRTWGKIYDTIYRKYLPKLDLLINVNQEIADQCEKEFGVKSLVIPNSSKYYQNLNQTREFSFPLRFIHHGVPNPDRKLEVMIEAFRVLGESYQFDLMLVQNGSEYYKSLEKMVGDIPNVRLIPSVSFDEIIPFISKYDLGVYSLAPISFNNQMALPNKFFEFVQARLPMVIGPSPVMSKYVEKYQIGKICRDFGSESLAEAIRSISREDLETFRTNLEIAAKELSIENFESELLKKVKEIC